MGVSKADRLFNDASFAAAEAYGRIMHPEVPGGGATIAEMERLADFLRWLVDSAKEGAFMPMANTKDVQESVRSKLGVDKP